MRSLQETNFNVSREIIGKIFSLTFNHLTYISKNSIKIICQFIKDNPNVLWFGSWLYIDYVIGA